MKRCACCNTARRLFDEIASEMSTMEYVSEGNGADRNDRDSPARASGVVHDAPRGCLLVVLVFTRFEDLVDDTSD